MVVVMVHPSSLSLSLPEMHRTARITWGETREREKSGEEEEGKNRRRGSERLSRGWRDKGEEIIRRKERGRKEWNGGTASRRIVERA